MAREPWKWLKWNGARVRAMKVAQMKWCVCVSRESGSDEMNILTPQNVRRWRIPPIRDYESLREKGVKMWGSGEFLPPKSALRNYSHQNTSFCWNTSTWVPCEIRDYESLREKSPTGPNYQVTEAESSQFPLYTAASAPPPSCHRPPLRRQAVVALLLPLPVIGHGIGGIDIPAKIARLAKSLSQE